MKDTSLILTLSHCLQFTLEFGNEKEFLKKKTFFMSYIPAKVWSCIYVCPDIVKRHYDSFDFNKGIAAVMQHCHQASTVEPLSNDTP